MVAAISSFSYLAQQGSSPAHEFRVVFTFEFAANTLAEATLTAFGQRPIDLLSRVPGTANYRHLVGAGAPGHTFTQASGSGQPSATTGRSGTPRNSNAVLSVRARTGAAAVETIQIPVPA